MLYWSNLALIYFYSNYFHYRYPYSLFISLFIFHYNYFVLYIVLVSINNFSSSFLLYKYLLTNCSQFLTCRVETYSRINILCEKEWRIKNFICSFFSFNNNKIAKKILKSIITRLLRASNQTFYLKINFKEYAKSISNLPCITFYK